MSLATRSGVGSARALVLNRTQPGFQSQWLSRVANSIASQRRDISIQALDERKGGTSRSANHPHIHPHKKQQFTDQTSHPDRQRIIVLGSGWAGYSLSRDLDPRKYQIVVVSPRSYFVFTPLLASTSVGTLEFRCALEPARARKGERQGPQFFQGWADGVNLEKRTLCIEEAVDDPMQGVALAGERGVGDVKKKVEKGKMFDMSWDKLVVSVGCYSQTFNTKGVREHAYFLKDVGDARRIRNRLLSCFEMASLPTTSEEMRKMLLNFAVVGGGPTGIEWSAELCDMIDEDMKQLYPDLVGYAKVRRSSTRRSWKKQHH